MGNYLLMHEDVPSLQLLDDTSLLLLEHLTHSPPSHSHRRQELLPDDSQYLDSSPICSDSISFSLDAEPVTRTPQAFTPSPANSPPRDFPPAPVLGESSAAAESHCTEVRHKSPNTAHGTVRIPNVRLQQITISSFNSIENNECAALLDNKRNLSSLNIIKAKPVCSKRRCCNCKKTKCLKLYCECFAGGVFCRDCGCENCCNAENHKEDIKEARKSREEKKCVRTKRIELERGEAGCNCKSSKCSKRYCECFKAGRKCRASCKCCECKNKDALQTFLYKKYAMTCKKTKADE